MFLSQNSFLLPIHYPEFIMRMAILHLVSPMCIFRMGIFIEFREERSGRGGTATRFLPPSAGAPSGRSTWPRTTLGWRPLPRSSTVYNASIVRNSNYHPFFCESMAPVFNLLVK